MKNNITKNLRATFRATMGVIALPIIVALSAVQGFIIGPIFKNQTAIPNFIFNTLKKLLGYKIEFNKASAPIVKNKPTWFVSNHMSIADFVVLGSKLDGTFAGKGEILKWPGIAQMAKALKYIGLRRSSEFNAESRGKIINNFNAGHNTIMFPEGTTTDGSRVAMFRGALPKLLFGETGTDKNKKEIKLETDVVVQPIAIRVKAINGENAIGNDNLRNLYSMYDEDKTLVRIWKRLQIKRTTLEITAFKPLKPADFDNERDLINEAARNVANIVNPGQKTFEKAIIPGQKKPS